MLKTYNEYHTLLHPEGTIYTIPLNIEETPEILETTIEDLILNSRYVTITFLDASGIMQSSTMHRNGTREGYGVSLSESPLQIHLMEGDIKKAEALQQTMDVAAREQKMKVVEMKIQLNGLADAVVYDSDGEEV